MQLALSTIQLLIDTHRASCDGVHLIESGKVKGQQSRKLFPDLIDRSIDRSMHSLPACDPNGLADSGGAREQNNGVCKAKE